MGSLSALIGTLGKCPDVRFISDPALDNHQNPLQITPGGTPLACLVTTSTKPFKELTHIHSTVSHKKKPCFVWSGFRTIFQCIRLATPNRYKFYMFWDRITISEIFIKNSDFFWRNFQKIFTKSCFLEAQNHDFLWSCFS